MRAAPIQHPIFGPIQPKVDDEPVTGLPPAYIKRLTRRAAACYIPVADGVQLAADVFLPPASRHSERVPALLYQTRYGRSLQLHFPLHQLAPLQTTTVMREEIAFYLHHGFAVVIVDVRGTGASTGWRRMEFDRPEVDDMAHILAWARRQPWSNGQLAANGVSYLGTTALMAGTHAHPALKAIVARSAIFDLFGDLAFPGGIHMGHFIRQWAETIAAMDRSNFRRIGGLGSRLVRSVRPVPGGPVTLQDALRDHRHNGSILDLLRQIEHRDDILPDTPGTIDDYAPLGHREALRQADVPTLLVTGWYDAALTQSAVKAFWNLGPRTELLIGPWNHGAKRDMNPFDAEQRVRFAEHEHIRRFLERHLTGAESGESSAPVTYYFLGEEAWRTAAGWPPPEAREQRLYLKSGGRLDNKPPRHSGLVARHWPEANVDSSPHSRWDVIFGPVDNRPMGYPDRAGLPLLSFRAQPLQAELRIAGHPVVQLLLQVEARDASLFVYLEDERPDGGVVYVTEGLLQLSQREGTAMPFEQPAHLPTRGFYAADRRPLRPGRTEAHRLSLLPIAYRFQAGHRLRLSLAFADRLHFETSPVPPEVGLFHRPNAASELRLPVIGA